ncbi:MAG: ribonuclease HIII [Limisphaerales bacterium]
MGSLTWLQLFDGHLVGMLPVRSEVKFATHLFTSLSVLWFFHLSGYGPLPLPKPITSYTRKLTDEESVRLREVLQDKGCVFGTVPHSRFASEYQGAKVVMYQSGKLVVQGKGAGDFVQFVLEPEVLGVAELGYEEVLHPELKLPRLGVDESGKGDLFGPLCVAGVYVNSTMIQYWRDAGIKDSKSISGDKRISQLAELIRKTPGCVWNVVPIGNPAYNRLYAKIGNVNRLLAWGHARVIENLLGERHRMVPPPERVVIDQFAASQSTVANALMTGGKGIEVVQRHKAESDLAVAAASILARDEFVRRLGELGQKGGVTLPKGAGPAANDGLRQWVDAHGAASLEGVAKLHFRNCLSL